MKKVFNNNQLTHVWANQSQAEGRSGSMFFEGTDIYSYGHHYLAARIHTVNGRKFALVNSNKYSNTTAKHLSLINRALQGLMPRYTVSDVSKPKAMLKELESKAKAFTNNLLKVNKITSESDADYYFTVLGDRYEELNNYRKMFNLKAIYPSNTKLDAIAKHLKARLVRYQELNSPEIVAERLAKRAAKAKAEQVQAIIEFRQGKRWHVHGLVYDLIRLQGKEVVTSSGASVPVKEAVDMLQALQSEPKHKLIGQSIGSFTLTDIITSEHDTVIVIGCHKIQLSEAKEVLSNIKPKLVAVK